MSLSVISRGGVKGLQPQIHVTAPTGSTVTATNGDKVITAQEKTDLGWDIILPSFGTWTVIGELDGEVTSEDVFVEEIKIYNIEIDYIP